MKGKEPQLSWCPNTPRPITPQPLYIEGLKQYEGTRSEPIRKLTRKKNFIANVVMPDKVGVESHQE